MVIAIVRKENKMNYYISDLHIGCKNKFDNRTLEHDEILVKNWNKVVHNDDNVYILGDIGRLGQNKDNEYVCSIVSRLKGQKHLVVGNHDIKGLKDNRVSQLFTEICDYKEIKDSIKIDKGSIQKKLVLSHYPIFSWNGAYSGTILLYGHTHNNFDNKIFQDSLQLLREKIIELNNLDENVKKFKSTPYAYNVGAMLDYIDYTPRTLQEIMSS